MTINVGDTVKVEVEGTVTQINGVSVCVYDEKLNLELWLWEDQVEKVVPPLPTATGTVLYEETYSGTNVLVRVGGENPYWLSTRNGVGRLDSGVERDWNDGQLSLDKPDET